MKKFRLGRKPSRPLPPTRPVTLPSGIGRIVSRRPVALEPAPPGGVSILEARAGQCRYVLPSGQCCGAGTPPGSSWCPACASVVLRRRA